MNNSNGYPEPEEPCAACTAAAIAPRDAGDAFIAGVAFALVYNTKTILTKMCESHTQRMIFAENIARTTTPIRDDEKR